jgi:hypothetical protein
MSHEAAGKDPRMKTQRRRFVAAVVLFVAWVACLATLAAVSSSRPRANQAKARAAAKG